MPPRQFSSAGGHASADPELMVTFRIDQPINCTMIGSSGSYGVDFAASPVPEPASMAAAALGGLSLLARRHSIAR